jgi:hypothetical protein
MTIETMVLACPRRGDREPVPAKSALRHSCNQLSGDEKTRGPDWSVWCRLLAYYCCCKVEVFTVVPLDADKTQNALE